MAYDPYSKTNQYIIDGGIAGIAFYLAHLIRFEGAIPPPNSSQLWTLIPVVIVLRLLNNVLFGIYHQIWRYISIKDALRITQASLAFSALLVVLRLTLPDQLQFFRIPMGVIAIDFLLVLQAVLSFRLLRRILYQRQPRRKVDLQQVKRVLLIGAGSTGVLTAKELLSRSDRKIVGFLDDNPKKIRALISGIRVLGPLDRLSEFVNEYEVSEVILCIGSAPTKALRRIWRLCDGLDVQILMMPALDEMIDGKVQVNRFRQASMEDLLARKSADHSVNKPKLVECYQAKRILIAGAGGSIGSELARQLAGFNPGQLLLVDKDENGLYELQFQLEAQTPKPCYRLLVADIRDKQRVENIFERFNPDVVFHAAAHKHVPLMELNPGEAVLNNVFGTKNLADQAISCGASSFVLISTDKAVNPSSVMGASKRLAELVVQSKGSDIATRFSCVRFGNVMSSRGSVIPLFQKQIATGGPITLTDPQVSRYLMTIPEAVQLLIQVGTLDSRNDGIFMLDMGDPVQIADLARDLIELSGLRPGHDIHIKTVGLRPGEKLREELFGDGEQLTRTDHPKILAVNSATRLEGEQFDALLNGLLDAAHQDNSEKIYHLFQEFKFGFRQEKPDLTLSDH